MTEIALLGFFALMLLLGLKRPFLWVLTYIYVDCLAPQKIGWAIMPHIPMSLIAFAAAFIGWLVFDRKEGTRFTFRQGLLLALLVYCGWTTMGALFPEDALAKWDWVWKSLVFAIFLPLTLRTRLRIEAAALFMVLSAGAIIISGGIKTIAGGGGYATLALFVNDNSGLYEGSTLSMVAIALIPLIFWIARNGTIYPKSRWTLLFAAALIFACLLIPIGTQTRTGLHRCARRPDAAQREIPVPLHGRRGITAGTRRAVPAAELPRAHVHDRERGGRRICLDPPRRVAVDARIREGPSARRGFRRLPREQLHLPQARYRR
jgi:hypothetical protein